MSDFLIEAKKLLKIYKLYDKPIDRFKESLHPLKKKYHREHYALDDVTFQLKRGEVLGVIGKNGAGKSTLLKVVTGVLSPTKGELIVRGRISSLLELGTGFNPELTGIENIYFNGTLNGYNKAEMNSKLDEILTFADIGEFINQPVKTYSSGMFARLAFALAINIEPDILILDEILGVGDFKFQQKCLRKINEIRDGGASIILVSHDTGFIKSYADRAIFLNQGKVVAEGDTEETIKSYVSFMDYDELPDSPSIECESYPEREKKGPEVESDLYDSSKLTSLARLSSFGGGGVEIERAGFFHKDGSCVDVLTGSESVDLVLQLKVNEDIYSPLIGFVVNDNYGNHIFGSNTEVLNQPIKGLKSGEKHFFIFHFNFPEIKDGVYSISPAVAEGTIANHEQQHWVHNAIEVQLISKDEHGKMGWCLKFPDVKTSIQDL